MQARTRQPLPATRPTAIARAVQTTLITLVAAHGAQAQTASPNPPPSQVIEVTGLRAALESALKAKREDTGIVDVIKAEDIAKFPDTNLAESLQRIPGVVIDRDGGEGRSITVRGLGGQFTRVRINGIEALATTGGTDASGGNNRGRGFDFNVFPSELFNSITVRKSASAEVDEGSLGATVDLNASRPFDFKGFTATASLKGRYNDLSKSSDPRAAFLISNTFADRTFGVLFSAAYSKRTVWEEGFSTVRWDNGPSSGGWCAPQGVTANPSTSTATTCGPAAQGVNRLPGSTAATDAYNLASSASNFHPRLPRYGRLTHDQERLGATSSIQWKPAAGTLLTAEMLYSKIDATRQEDFLEAMSFSRALTQGGKPQVSVVSSTYDANGALIKGVYNGVDIRAESRYDQLSTTFTQPTLTLEQELSDTLKLTAKVGRAESKFRNPIQTTTTLDVANVNGYTIDFSNSTRLPAITYPFDVTQVGGALGIIGAPQTNGLPSEIRVRPQGTNNRTDQADVVLEWDAVPGKLAVKGGASYKQYDFDTYEFRRANTGETIGALPAGVSLASVTTTLTGFGSGLSLPAGTPTSWVIPNLAALASAYDIYCNCIKSGAAGGPGDFTLTSITNGNARGNNRSVSERYSGGFVMADFNTSVGGIKLRGNGGLRWVKTEQSSTGYLATGGGTPVTVERSYTDVLPALNVSADLTRDLVLRASAAKVMSRPAQGQITPGGTISTSGTLTISTGNPLLNPIRAKTFDLNLEWYHGRNAFIGVGLFQKNISSYIQTLRQNLAYKDTGLPMSLLPSGFNGDEVFQVTYPINTEGGKLTGFEINVQQPFTFLPGALRNTGVVLNYSQVKSRINYLVSPTATTTITDDLIGLSPRSANATLYYDDGTFSARISASKRSSFLTLVPGQNNNDVEGTNGSTNVDLSISYKLNDKLEFTFEGLNLTNEAKDQFISRARNSAVVYHVTGREYLVGMRYKF